LRDLFDANSFSHADPSFKPVPDRSLRRAAATVNVHGISDYPKPPLALLARAARQVLLTALKSMRAGQLYRPEGRPETALEKLLLTV
jgi:hypothetical protein